MGCVSRILLPFFCWSATGFHAYLPIAFYPAALAHKYVDISDSHMLYFGSLDGESPLRGRSSVG
jgi:hypothetical protein